MENMLKDNYIKDLVEHGQFLHDIRIRTSPEHQSYLRLDTDPPISVAWSRAMSTGTLLLALALLALLIALVACCCRRRKAQGQVLSPPPPAPPGPLQAVQAPYPQQQYAPAPYPVATSYPTQSAAPYPAVAPYPAAAPYPATAGPMPVPGGGYPAPFPAPYPSATPYSAAPFSQPLPDAHYPTAPSAPEAHDVFDLEIPSKSVASLGPAPARPPRRARPARAPSPLDTA